MFATEPVETEGFNVRAVGGADLFGEGREGGVKRWFVEVDELRNGVVHAVIFRINERPPKLSLFGWDDDVALIRCWEMTHPRD